MPAALAEARLPPPPFRHLLRLSDSRGVFEHARFTEPRIELGYCVDDVARALVVVMREPAPVAALDRLAGTCLAFLEASIGRDGVIANRCSVAGRWSERSSEGDAQGRALQALGTCAAHAREPSMRRRALAAFARVEFASAHPRANAHAVVGAAEVVRVRPQHPAARHLLEQATALLGAASTDPAWPWPDPRLGYANALLTEARIAAGSALGAPGLTAEGLALLDWLIETERSAGHFSFTPVDGAGPDDPRPAFDQQPIEAGAMADACARAFALTGQPHYREAVDLAARWFVGRNDTGTPLLDEASGGGCDGLTSDGRNENQGAESTIALITALQHARRLGDGQATARSALTRARPSMIAAPTQRSAAP